MIGTLLLSMCNAESIAMETQTEKKLSRFQRFKTGAKSLGSKVASSARNLKTKAQEKYDAHKNRNQRDMSTQTEPQLSKGKQLKKQREELRQAELEHTKYREEKALEARKTLEKAQKKHDKHLGKMDEHKALLMKK